jgi:hypothetical protein
MTGGRGIMKRIRSMVVFLAVVLFVAFVMPAGVTAQQFELTFGSPYNVDHPFSKTDQKWFAKIEKETTAG